MKPLFTADDFVKDDEYKIIYDKYRVYSDGRIIAHQTGKEIKQNKINSGYLAVRLNKMKGQQDRWLVHRLVAHVFIGPCPKGLQVNHVDGNKENNNIINLEYVTKKENIRHARLLGLMPKQCYRKLTDEEVKDIKTLIEIKNKYKTKIIDNRMISKIFGVTSGMIGLIEKKKAWKDIKATWEEVK